MGKNDTQQTTVVLWGGVDPGGQAGLAADLQAANALGAQTRLVVTALTAQGGNFWLAGWPVPDTHREAVVKHLDLPANGVAFKSGMLSTRSHAAALMRLRKLHPSAPLVVDPLEKSSSGGLMWQAEDIAGLPAWLLQQVLPHASVVTPNWPELAWLTGRVLASYADAIAALRLLPCAAVLKGGHAPEALRGVDVVWENGIATELQPTHMWSQSPRGTGCRLATAIAIGLARGESLLASTAAAKALVAQLAEAQGV